MNLLNILPLILNLQNKIMGAFYSKYLGIDEVKPTMQNKTYFTSNMTLELNSNVKKEAEKVKLLAKSILKKYMKKPNELLKFIEAKGTLVVKANNIDIILNIIGEAEGFIAPINGFKAFILTIAINILSSQKVKIAFKTKEMFIMRNLEPNIFILAHQVHHWLAYKKGLPGYDSHTLKTFKKAWGMDNEVLKTFKIKDILAVKDAISRDKEAIDLVNELSKEYSESEKALKQIKEGKSIKL